MVLGILLVRGLVGCLLVFIKERERDVDIGVRVVIEFDMIFLS